MMLAYILNLTLDSVFLIVQKYIKNDIEEGLEEEKCPYDFKIPDCYSTQEELDRLV